MALALQSRDALAWHRAYPLPDECMGLLENRARAWLFADSLKFSQAGEGIIGVLWLAPLLGFVLGAWGYFAQQTWWASAALAAAILSSAMILLWWGSLNTSSAIFALLFNLVVLVVVLWQQRMFQPAAAARDSAKNPLDESWHPSLHLVSIGISSTFNPSIYLSIDDKAAGLRLRSACARKGAFIWIKQFPIAYSSR